MKIKSYKDLQIWQKAIDLADNLFFFLKSFPASQNFVLVAQMQRAVVSVASNIAEGSVRESSKDFLRFLNISYGSLCELETQLIISKNAGYIKENDYKELAERITEIAKMINSYSNKIKKTNI